MATMTNGTLSIGKPDGTGWVQLGAVDGLTFSFADDTITADTDDEHAAAVRELWAGGTITMNIRLTPAQAHEWRWWLHAWHRWTRRPHVTGPRPLAYGCLPKRGRRR